MPWNWCPIATYFKWYSCLSKSLIYFKIIDKKFVFLYSFLTDFDSSRVTDSLGSHLRLVDGWLNKTCKHCLRVLLIENWFFPLYLLYDNNSDSKWIGNDVVSVKYLHLKYVQWVTSVGIAINIKFLIKQYLKLPYCTNTNNVQTSWKYSSYKNLALKLPTRVGVSLQ